MSILDFPTLTLTRSAAALAMAEIQESIHLATYNASEKQIVTYFENDGADRTADEGIILSWLEVRFPTLAGKMNVSESSGHIMLRISGIDPDGESFRLMEDLPSGLRYVNEGSWS